MKMHTRYLGNVVNGLRAVVDPFNDLNGERVDRFLNASISKIHRALAAAATEMYVLAPSLDAEFVRAGFRDEPALHRVHGKLSDSAAEDPGKFDHKDINWTLKKLVPEGDGKYRVEFRRGLWPVVYQTKHSIWINKYKTGKTAGKGPARNLAAQKKEVERYGEIKEPDVLLKDYCDSTAVIPLLHDPTFDKLNAKAFWGLLNIELHHHEEFDKDDFELLCSFAEVATELISKAAKFEDNDAGSERAVTQWEEFDPLKDYSARREGMLIQSPMAPSTSIIEKALTEYFQSQSVRLHVLPCSSLTDERLQRTHFAIFDLTGFAPGVIGTMGMAAASGIPQLSIRLADDAEANKDEAPLPQVLANKCFGNLLYSVESDEIRLWPAGSSERRNISEVLEGFVHHLREFPAFAAAAPHKVSE